MNPHLQQLHPYPFERLRHLFADLHPPADRAPISLSIGEPRHASPAFVLAEIAANLDRLSNYPSTAGLPELRQAIAAWLQRRFALPGVDADLVRPLAHRLKGLFEKIYLNTKVVKIADTGNGVRATAICPAFVDTRMAAWTGIPGEEMIAPEDCAEVVRALLRLSPSARIP